MLKISGTKAILLLSVIAVATMLGSWYLTAYAFDDSTNSTTTQQGRPGIEFQGGLHGSRMGGGRECNGFIEVSAEYNQTVINIAKNDSDVQNLLTEGYNISAIRPIMKSTIQADGTVVTKAANAIVILTKVTSGRASVLVDVTAGKVTRIEILTRIVIDKS
ncbi:MAG: hypothetical protein QG670_2114 [Thermoproteota archaeon]|nr:hypothetical protein [Thermoproteota archaeon]